MDTSIAINRAEPANLSELSVAPDMSRKNFSFRLPSEIPAKLVGHDIISIYSKLDKPQLLQTLYSIAMERRVGAETLPELSLDEARELLSANHGYVKSVNGIPIELNLELIFPPVDFGHAKQGFNHRYGAGVLEFGILLTALGISPKDTPLITEPSIVGQTYDKFGFTFATSEKPKNYSSSYIRQNPDIILSAEGCRKVLPKLGWSILKRDILDPVKLGGTLIGKGSEGDVFKLSINGLDLAVKVYNSETQAEMNKLAGLFRLSFDEPDFRRKFLETRKTVELLQQISFLPLKIKAISEYAAGENFVVTSLGPKFSLCDVFNFYKGSKPVSEEVRDFISGKKITAENFEQISSIINLAERIIYLASQSAGIQKYGPRQANTSLEFIPGTHRFEEGALTVANKLLEDETIWIPRPDFDLGNFLIEDFDSNTGIFTLVLIDQGAEKAGSSRMQFSSADVDFEAYKITYNALKNIGIDLDTIGILSPDKIVELKAIKLIESVFDGIWESAETFLNGVTNRISAVTSKALSSIRQIDI